MTVKELYEQTAQLGFEDSLENIDRFYQAANRAILQVNSLRPAVNSYIINHRPLENEIVEDTFCPVDKKEDICFEAQDVKAYYFEADGNGTAIIERVLKNGSVVLVSKVELVSNRQFKPYKGLIKDAAGTVRIRFTGDYIFSVKNVAMYKYLLSANAEDIPPYTPYTRYDMSRLVNDFVALNEAPAMLNGERLYMSQDILMEGESCILVPRSTKGIIKVTYKKALKALEFINKPDEDVTKIDLDEELCSLLPPLVASFVWAEDEPNLANYYMNIYREWANRIEAQKIDYSNATMKNYNGW